MSPLPPVLARVRRWQYPQAAEGWLEWTQAILTKYTSNTLRQADCLINR